MLKYLLTWLVAFLTCMPAGQSFALGHLRDTPNDRPALQQQAGVEYQQFAQRGGLLYRAPRTNNYGNQQRLQQQRLQQQQMQRQRMQQQRQQQALQRQRMMQQRQQQQAAMRVRQQQMMAQRQRLAQQRQAAQQRQQQQLQRRQGQQQQAARSQLRSNQQAARSRIARQVQQHKLRQIRENAQRLEKQKAAAKNATDLSLAATLKSGSSLTAVKSPTFTDRIKTTQNQLQKLREQRAPLKVDRAAAKDLSDKTARIAALRKNFRNCSTTGCNCSFHGDTLVKTKRGLVPIRSIRENEDYVWAKDEHTGDQDWKLVTHHYSNTYDEIVEIEIRDSDGTFGKILSNRIHPFYARNDKQQKLNLAAISYKATDFWIEAADLRPGYRLLQADEKWATVATVSISTNRLIAYNISVADFHTFFVSPESTKIERAVWVHNDCPPQLPKTLKKKFRRVEIQAAAGGNKSVRGTVTSSEAESMGKRWVGNDYRDILRDGRRILISKDGLRQFRFPADKRGFDPINGKPWSKTGTQVNFESRKSRQGGWTGNVHLDVAK